MNKIEYRKIYKNIRNNIHKNEVYEKSNSIYELLCSKEEFINAEIVFVYLSYNNEVATDRVIEHLLLKGKTVLIPWCDTESETMQAVIYDKNVVFKKNIYGINEIDNPKVYNGRIDLTIVPGIAFDRLGNRIGYGKGYYDKFLKNVPCYKIGLSYSDTITDDNIPNNAEDVLMDCVISDREVLEF